MLGLNILTQLQQKLKTEEDIKEFAYKIVSQSGVFLKLNNDQIQLHLRNNEGNLSPTNSASINKKAILVSIPSPDKNEGLKKFADKLEDAFRSNIKQGNARIDIIIDRESQRTDELSVMTVSYCYPMRAIDWMSTYKTRYEKFLNTGNPNTDASNAILLHSEGDGKDLPSLFALTDEEIQKRLNAAQPSAPATPTAAPTGTPFGASTGAPAGAPFGAPAGGPGMPPPPMPGGAPLPPPPPVATPTISLYMAVNGQNYGPYTWDVCKQLVQNGQLTPQTMVWMDGMAAWSPAGQVPTLQPLFAPAAPPMPPATPGMPPMPPTAPGMPPMMQ